MIKKYRSAGSKEEKMKRAATSGQSVLEYTLLVGAIIAVLVTVLLKQGGMVTHVGTAYNQTGIAFSKAVSDLTTNAFR
jgi:Flp pilus assembly pilin Flp